MRDLFNLMSNTTDEVVAIDSDQRIVFWNQGAEMLFGFKAKEVLGRFCYDVIGGQAEACHFGCQRSCLPHMEALRQHTVPTRNLLVRTKAGREIWVCVSTIVVPSKWKELCLLIHLCRDISRQKDLENCVQQFLACIAKLSSPLTTDQPANPLLASQTLNLTDREWKVLRLLSSGTSTRAIANQLFISISPSTVRNHIHNILTKLGVHSQLEATVLALRNGLI
jgi:PAS domain S-box-containing protein